MNKQKGIFSMEWDHSHLIDSDADAFHVSFEGSDLLGARKLLTTPLILPDNRMIFQANFRSLAETDYPIDDLGLNIISRRLYELIVSFGDFSHITFPAVMLDDTEPYENVLARNPELSAESSVKYDYVIIQLLQHLDALDLERSEYRCLRSNPEKISVIKKIVLNESVPDIPPIFRLSVKRNILFIRQDVKDAIENNNFRGIVFRDYS